MRRGYFYAGIFSLLLMLALPPLTPLAWAQPNVTATLQDELVVDVDNDGLADPGDTIRYRVVISNTGDDAEGMSLDVLLDTLTTLVPGSLTGTPLAFDGSFTTDEESAVAITLVGADIEGDTLMFSVASGPSDGSLGAVSTVSANEAMVTYTPDVDFAGSDSFTFMVDDGGDGTAEAMVTVTVAEVNDAPSFTKGADETVDEDAGP